jgi:hypothetical protein
MQLQDRLANLALLAAAAGAWFLVWTIVTTRDPIADPAAGYLGAFAIGLGLALTAAPVCWLAVFARHRRIAYSGDWLRAGRRGIWLGLLAGTAVVLRLVDAFQLPIILFLAAIVVVAEMTLSAER